jgi:hypothetical protein
MPQAIWYTLDESVELNNVPETITSWHLSTEFDRDFNGQTVYAINVRFRLDNPNDYIWVMNHIRMYFEDHAGDDFIREFPVEITY